MSTTFELPVESLIRRQEKKIIPKPMKKPDPKYYEQIKTFEDAFQIAKGHFKMKKLPDFSSMFSDEMTRGLTAFLKLQVVAWAINNDNLNEVPEWTPDHRDTNQSKWSVVYRVMCGEFLPVQNQKDWKIPSIGGRLVFKDEKRSFHADTYFRDLFREFYTIELEK